MVSPHARPPDKQGEGGGGPGKSARTAVTGRLWAEDGERSTVESGEGHEEEVTRMRFLRNEMVMKDPVDGWRNRRGGDQTSLASGAGAPASRSMDGLQEREVAAHPDGRRASAGVEPQDRWVGGGNRRRTNNTAPDEECFSTILPAGGRKRQQEFTPPSERNSSKAARVEGGRTDLTSPGNYVAEQQGRGRGSGYRPRRAQAFRGGRGGVSSGRGAGEEDWQDLQHFQGGASAGRGRGGTGNVARGVEGAGMNRGGGGRGIGRSYREAMGVNSQEERPRRGREGTTDGHFEADTAAARRRVITVDVDLPEGHTVVSAPVLADICRRIGIVQGRVRGVQALYKKVELLVDEDLEIPVVLGRRDQLIRGQVVLRNIREEDSQRAVKVRVMGMS